MAFTNQKLSIAGRLIELYSFENPIPYGYQRHTINTGRRVAKESDDFEVTLRSAGYRARAKLRRLCFANAWRWKLPNGDPMPPIFNTYTFRDNVTDRQTAHAEFAKAMERLKYQWRNYLPDGLKYVVVPERQERGAIHYHQLAFNLPYIPRIYDWLAQIWGQGFTFVKTANGSRALFSYIGKYLAKDMASARDFNGKRYFASRGLNQPSIFRDEKQIKSIIESLPADTQIWDSPKPIDHPDKGKIFYRRYLLPHDIEIPQDVLSRRGEMESLVGAGDDNLSTPIGTPDNGASKDCPLTT